MNRILKAMLISCTMAAFCWPSIDEAAAQTALRPIDSPVVSVPSAPSGAKESYDANAIEQLMKIVELSRVIGGGIEQMLEGLSGTSTLPNSVSLPEKDGGAGLKEMADAALQHSLTGPGDTNSAIDALTADYHLEKAFALKDDPSPTRTITAHAAAQGAIVAATAEDSYKRANASAARLDSYLTALKSSSSLKTSIDLNTRVMIEIAQALDESLRTQSAIASGVGTYLMVTYGAVGQNDAFIKSLMNFNR